MADPAKMAALSELAETGSFSGQSAALSQSKDQALSRQSALGGLIGAPAQAQAAVAPTVEAPYGRFLGALNDYMGGYQQSAATLAGANDTYMQQVADAQSVHRAEADQAIGEARSRYEKANGAGEYDPLSQWEIENFAEGKGQEYQQQAQAEASQTAEQSAADAEIARMLEGWATIGEEDAKGERAIEHATGGANEQEKAAAAEQWDKLNPMNDYDVSRREYQRGSGGVYETEGVDPLADRIIREQREIARNQHVEENAGQERRDAYLRDVEARNQKIVMPDGTELSRAEDPSRQASVDDPTTPQNEGTAAFSESRDYAQQRTAESIQAARDAELIALYTGPEFKRQAAVDYNLRPDLGDQQEAFFRGMFPDQTPEELMDEAKARRELEYFERTGYGSPSEQRSWEEAQRKNEGIPDPNNRQVRRPDDPDVQKITGLDEDDVARITTSEQWEFGLQTTENLIAGDEENGIPAVRSAAQLRMSLDAADPPIDPNTVELLVAMYAPSMRG